MAYEITPQINLQHEERRLKLAWQQNERLENAFISNLHPMIAPFVDKRRFRSGAMSTENSQPQTVTETFDWRR